MSTLLRPNTATVQRKATTGRVSNTGAPIPAGPETVYAELPCFIESALTRAEIVTAGGAAGQPVTTDTVMMVADGVNVSGCSPGDVVTVNGVMMIVAANGRAAFPDLRNDDKITREDGTEYLVLRTQSYPDVFPNIQAHLALGKAWT